MNRNSNPIRIGSIGSGSSGGSGFTEELDQALIGNGDGTASSRTAFQTNVDDGVRIGFEGNPTFTFDNSGVVSWNLVNTTSDDGELLFTNGISFGGVDSSWFRVAPENFWFQTSENDITGDYSSFELWSEEGWLLFNTQNGGTNFAATEDGGILLSCGQKPVLLESGDTVVLQGDNGELVDRELSDPWVGKQAVHVDYLNSVLPTPGGIFTAQQAYGADVNLFTNQIISPPCGEGSFGSPNEMGQVFPDGSRIVGAQFVVQRFTTNTIGAITFQLRSVPANGSLTGSISGGSGVLLLEFTIDLPNSAGAQRYYISDSTQFLDTPIEIPNRSLVFCVISGFNATAARGAVVNVGLDIP